MGHPVRRWAAASPPVRWAGHDFGYAVLVLVIFSPPADARLEARGAPPWPAPDPAQLASGYTLLG